MEGLAGITDRFRLLGDATRLRVLRLLQDEELTVGELAAALGQGQSTVSGHLARLREAGLVQDRRDGTRSYYRRSAATSGEEGRLFELLDERLEQDPVLLADRARLEQVVLARSDGSWVDRAAGSLDRRYVPGRSWESVALALSCLVDLGDCVDMGSGDGALLDLVAPACRSLVCIDNHAGMVEAGQKRARGAPHRQVRFLLGDMHEPPLPFGAADTVLFLQSLQYAADPKRALAAAARLLRAGGRCLVLTLGKHDDARLRQDYGHAHLGFAPAALRGLLQRAGLEVARCDAVGHDPRSPQLPIVVAVATLPGSPSASRSDGAAVDEGKRKGKR
jgi:ArsR family transcriptional regulator